ncbi:MAG: hypothetical protein ACM3ST_04940 [Bdellovibrio bacteriovorus]
MNTSMTRVLIATAALLLLGFGGIDRVAAAAGGSANPTNDATGLTGSVRDFTGPSMMGPGMMGPGMMYNWTPEQRRQHWEQMRRWGYGPGMMGNWTPEQWQQMHQWGNGPGIMMGPPQGSAPNQSGR